jgi:hypothetical protein
MDNPSTGTEGRARAGQDGQDEYLYLWRVLLEELRFLRPRGRGLHDPVFDDAGAKDSRCLAALFARVHAWNGPVGAADIETAQDRLDAETKAGAAASGSAGERTGDGTSAAATPAPEASAADTPPLAALCFSGGGIRSATFNLGVIQGLAKAGLLGRFDYLSSVSGGGYIAGWLGRWLKVAKGGVQGCEAVQRALAAKPPLDVEAPEAPQVTWLRAFSNYLTPRLGLLSADTWTLAAIGVRNILLNWLVLVPLLTAPLLIPLLAVARWPAIPEGVWPWLLGAAAFLEALGLYFVNLFSDTGDEMRAAAARSGAAETAGPPPARKVEPEHPRPEAAKPKGHPYLMLGMVPRLLALPLLLVGFSLCFFGQSPRPAAPTFSGLLLPALAWAIGLPLLALWASGPLFGRRRAGVLENSLWLVLAGAGEAAILAGVFAGWAPQLIQSPHPLYPILGPGLVLGPVLLGRTLYVALSSVGEHMRLPDFDDAEREWWARWSGWALICAVVWIAVSAMVLFAPTLLASARAQLAALISAGGLGGLIAGLGSSGRTPPTEEKAANPDQGGGRLQSLLMGLAAPLFVVAVVLCLSTGAQHLLAAVQGDPWPPPAASAAPEVNASGSLHVEIAAPASAAPAENPPEPLRADFKVKGGTSNTSALTYVAPYGGCGAAELLAIAALVLFGVLAGYPVNINRFSMQAGYRNRLIRAYLGASNDDRKPNAFTGFDRRDNVPLCDLRRNRPFPVINIALNLVRGQNLAWQERKAESFTATPLHCGSYQLGYRRTDFYGGQGGLSLGSAVATSGAAANPNMGFNSSPAITFIMTLFSVRLGAWLGNPHPTGRFAAGRFATYKRNGPRFSALVLLAEAFGWTDSTHPYISVSDGGHFEDLGLYEMVRRRCRFILVSDAGADPDYGFKDLGNAIRKIRIDFGIPIVFTDRVYIFPKKDASDEGRYCAVAEIQYRAVDGAEARHGTLIYIKPSICRLPSPTPFDVANYARFSRDFPHETTADQWFSETQFESYRALGEDAIRAMAGGSCASLDDFAKYVTATYLPKTKAKGQATDVTPAGSAAQPPGAT